jgi:hypothetical protein
MKSIKIFVLFLVCSLISIYNCIAQTNAHLLNKIGFKDIPKQINIPFNMVSSYKWRDKEGDNYLILTNLKRDTSINKDMFGGGWKTGFIELYHYLKKGDDIKLLNYIKDNTEPCDGSYINEFINNSITITDLNANGIGEITLQYKYACRSDIIPADKTLIFFESDTISTLKGIMMSDMIYKKVKNEMNWEKLTESEKKKMDYSGYYFTEKNVKHKSQKILKHIRKQWNLHIFENK